MVRWGALIPTPSCRLKSTGGASPLKSKGEKVMSNERYIESRGNVDRNINERKIGKQFLFLKYIKRNYDREHFRNVVLSKISRIIEK